MKNRNLNHSDNWQTPPEFYRKLDKIYNFDFDPCPLNHDLSKWDALKPDCFWGKMNFINPPYSQKLKEGFIKKAQVLSTLLNIHSVLLLPVSTSTKIFHSHIYYIADIEFIQGRIPFIGVNQYGQRVNWHLKENGEEELVNSDDKITLLKKGKEVEEPLYIKNSGQHDSMLVIY